MKQWFISISMIFMSIFTVTIECFLSRIGKMVPYSLQRSHHYITIPKFLTLGFQCGKGVHNGIIGSNAFFGNRFFSTMMPQLAYIKSWNQAKNAINLFLRQQQWQDQQLLIDGKLFDADDEKKLMELVSVIEKNINREDAPISDFYLKLFDLRLKNALRIYLEKVINTKTFDCEIYDNFNTARSLLEFRLRSFVMRCFIEKAKNHEDHVKMLPHGMQFYQKCLYSTTSSPTTIAIRNGLMGAFFSTYDKIHTVDKKFLDRVLVKEAEESARGNYVFYHSQSWDNHFFSDFYKQLWNGLNVGAKAGDDFVFTRFELNESVKNLRNDSLFLNVSLVGNRIAGENSLIYYVSNWSVRRQDPHVIIKKMFHFFGIEKLCADFFQEIETLRELHQAANDSTHGNLMLLSVKPTDVQRFQCSAIDGTNRPVQRIDGTVTTDTKEIIDTLYSYSSSNLKCSDEDLIFTLPLTKAYGLDPKNGPRFYNFHEADSHKIALYENMRDKLIKKIVKHSKENSAQSMLLINENFIYKFKTFMKQFARIY